MNLSINMAYFRRRRGDIAALTVVVSFLFGFVLMFVGLYWMLDLFEATRWGDRPESGGSICIVATVGEALVLFSILLYTYSRNSITFISKLGYGLLAYRQGRYFEADCYAREAWQYAELLAPDDPFRGRVLEQLCRTSRVFGNYDEAEARGQNWLESEKLAWGDRHPRVADALEELADIYDKIARHHQARPLLEKALVIREANRRSDGIAYVLCLDALGMLWCRLEQFHLAEPYFRKALANADRLDRRSPDRFRIACNLSLACVHLDNLVEAEQLAESELVIAEKHPEPAWMPIAYCLGHLAYVRRFQERFDEAEELIQRSMAIFRKAVPNNPMALHGDLHLLGVIHRHQSRWAEAEECFVEVLRLRQEYLAPEDLAIARVLEDYAELLELMGRMDEAQTHQNQAKQIRDFHSPFRLV